KVSTLDWNFVRAGVAQGQSNCLVSSGSGVQILPPAPAFVPRLANERFSSHAGRFGEVPKWPKGADCKSAGVRLRGFKSSPPHHFSECLEAGSDRGWAERDATTRGTRGARGSTVEQASLSGNSSAVERQPSTLGGAGSNPVSRSKARACAHVAQSVERVLGKDEVSGSIPDMGSISIRIATANGRV